MTPFRVLDVAAPYVAQLQRLERQARRIWRYFQQCETEYHDHGLSYHAFPMLIRNLRVSEATDNCYRDFVIIGNTVPHMITRLQQGREAKAEAELALLVVAAKYVLRDYDGMRRDLLTAKQKLREVDQLVDDIKEDVATIGHHMSRYEHAIAEHEANHGPLADKGLPDKDAHPRKYAMLRAWVLTTPDAQQRIDEEGFTEDEAFEAGLAGIADKHVYETDEEEWEENVEDAAYEPALGNMAAPQPPRGNATAGLNLIARAAAAAERLPVIRSDAHGMALLVAAAAQVEARSNRS